MSAEDSQQQQQQYIQFPEVPHGTLGEDGLLMLNRFSSHVTKGHDFPGAQVSLLA